jgi:hypothetical protein
MRGKFAVRGTFEFQADRDDNSLVEGVEAGEFRVRTEEMELSLEFLEGSVPLSTVAAVGDAECQSPFPSASPNADPELVTGMVPHRAFIARGGSVTFRIAPYTQVAVYEPGTNLVDIDINSESLEDVTFGPFTITNYRINDPNHRVALSPGQTQSGLTWTTPAGTFDRPGGYLVISTSTPHFAFGHAHGWVIVR